MIKVCGLWWSHLKIAAMETCKPSYIIDPAICGTLYILVDRGLDVKLRSVECHIISPIREVDIDLGKCLMPPGIAIANVYSLGHNELPNVRMRECEVLRNYNYAKITFPKWLNEDFYFMLHYGFCLSIPDNTMRLWKLDFGKVCGLSSIFCWIVSINQSGYIS